MKSPYLTMREVAERYRFLTRDGQLNPKGALDWLDVHKIRTKKLGRRVLVHEDEIEAAMTERRRAS